MDKIADIASSVVTVALIFVLVRPNSQGPQFVSNIGSSFATVLNAATGGATW
jgi:hypothetical protein